MKVSTLIAHLQAAQNQHGDLEIYTPDTDIASLRITACRDGVYRTSDGVPEDEPNELVVEFLAAY